MTAAELYELVKDLPPEASPHCYGSASDGRELHWYYERDGIKYVVDVEAVVLGYEASVARWIERQAVSLECTRFPEGDDTYAAVARHAGQNIIRIEPTKLRALIGVAKQLM